MFDHVAGIEFFIECKNKNLSPRDEFCSGLHHLNMEKDSFDERSAIYGAQMIKILAITEADENSYNESNVARLAAIADLKPIT